jgi:hypothetical protein
MTSRLTDRFLSSTRSPASPFIVGSAACRDRFVRSHVRSPRATAEWCSRLMTWHWNTASSRARDAIPERRAILGMRQTRATLSARRRTTSPHETKPHDLRSRKSRDERNAILVGDPCVRMSEWRESALRSLGAPPSLAHRHVVGAKRLAAVGIRRLRPAARNAICARRQGCVRRRPT